MRGMKTARALSEIDDDLILEAMPANTITVTRKAPWKYIAMASSIALVLCIGIFAVIVGSKSGSKYIDTDSTSTSSEYEKRYVDPDSSAADDKQKTWDEMSLTEKYPIVQLSANAASGLYTTANAPIEESRIVGKLISGVVSVNAAAFEGLVKKPSDRSPDHLSAEVYSIKNIDSRYAIALKFIKDASMTDNFDNFYVYVNSSADPDSFETLVNALDFSATVTFSQAYYYPGDGKTIGFEGLDKTKILDILLENAKGAKSVPDPDSFLSKQSYKKRLDLATNLDTLGVRNKSLSVTDDGYLMTNLLSTARVFFIGKETAQKLTDHITSNYKGYELIFRNSSDSSKTDNKPQSGAGKDSSTAQHTTTSKTDSSSAAPTTTKPKQEPTEKRWEDKNGGERYPVIGEYHYTGMTLSVDKTGAVGNAYETAKGKDPITGAEYTTNCYFFYIKGLDTADVVVFLFEDDFRPLAPSVDPDETGESKEGVLTVKYYIYAKDLNSFSCEQIARSLNFTKQMTINAAVCTNVDGSKTRYSEFDTEKVIATMFGITTTVTPEVKQVDPSTVNFKPSISMIYVYQPFYDEYGTNTRTTQSTLEISDDGYLRISILNHEFMYNIGKENVQKVRGLIMTTSKRSEPAT